VRIQLKRESGVEVAEPFGHGPDVNPGADKLGRHEVTEIV
jgi:hypothetical protein